MSGCKRCQTISKLEIPEDIFLCLIVPFGHTKSKIKKALNDIVEFYDSDKENILLFATTKDKFTKVCDLFAHTLTNTERDQIICTFSKSSKDTLTTDDLSQISNLTKICAQVAGEWLIDLIEQKRLTHFYQPIVSSKNNEIFGYECLLRGISEKGDYISPAALFQNAQSADFLFYLDRESRIIAIQNAKKNNITKNIFINFTPLAIYDPEYCLQTTIAEANKQGLSCEKLVFEVIESEKLHDLEHLKRIVDYYKQHGFRVALDDLGSGYSSLNLLHMLQPDFVKLDMQMIRDIDKHPTKRLILESVVELAKKLNILVIAEGIETEQELAVLKQIPIDFYQGYYFAKPTKEPIKKIN